MVCVGSVFKSWALLREGNTCVLQMLAGYVHAPSLVMLQYLAAVYPLSLILVCHITEFICIWRCMRALHGSHTGVICRHEILVTLFTYWFVYLAYFSPFHYLHTSCLHSSHTGVMFYCFCSETLFTSTLLVWVFPLLLSFSIAGFVSAISEAAPDLRFTLLTLQVSSAYGAAALGAKKKEFTLALDYASHTSVLYCHEL